MFLRRPVATPKGHGATVPPNAIEAREPFLPGPGASQIVETERPNLHANFAYQSEALLHTAG